MYYIVYGFLYLISLLPIGVLYLLSDLIYIIVYYLVGYRKPVVRQNLLIAFPHKTEKERIKISKKFYKNFCDTFIETIKFISAPEKFFRKRFAADFSVVHQLHQTGKSVQVHLGHNFNWELANLALPLFIPYKILSVYRPLNNKIIDRLFKKIRRRFGTHLIASSNMKNDMLPHRSTQYFIALIADQSPHTPGKAYWVNFFGKPTAFLKGPEKAARINNFPVIFAHFTKTKRGHYTGHGTLAEMSPKDLPEGELTKKYAQFLERVITEHPEVWLWSHRRWKKKRKPEYGKVI
ncbi:MAG: lipid A biosynthesis acyltransferase [Chitinophagaceae bacterium]|nr:lipid A biosynthesis acyltransferase [Chitinophagaceae bacterium]